MIEIDHGIVRHFVALSLRDIVSIFGPTERLDSVVAVLGLDGNARTIDAALVAVASTAAAFNAVVKTLGPGGQGSDPRYFRFEPGAAIKKEGSVGTTESFDAQSETVANKGGPGTHYESIRTQRKD